MATRNERFPSRFLKASDLLEDTVATIARVIEEQIGEEKESKPVAYWRERDLKPYPLNATNWDACATLSGKADDQQWAGLRVLLTKTQVMFRKELRDTIRIVAPPAPPAKRPPVRKVAAAPEPDPMPTAVDDDEDPF